MTLAERASLEKLRESELTNTPIEGAATSPPGKLPNHLRRSEANRRHGPRERKPDDRQDTSRNDE